MFFFFGGLQTKIKNVIRYNIGSCGNVNCHSKVDLVEGGEEMSIFFIPIWTFGMRQYVACSDCKYMATEIQYKQHIKMKEKAYPVRTGPISDSVDIISSCKICGQKLGEDWIFCPSCGTDNSTEEPLLFEKLQSA